MDIVSFLWANGVSFIVILSVIVFVHEMGHYLVARANGVRVEIFSIGFGPELFGWTSRAGTRWKVSVLPLGGYVKMFGDAGAASTPSERVHEMSPEDRRVSFHNKGLLQRTAIVSAGPLANFALALVILAGLYATVGQRVTPPVISRVIADSPAAAAGFQPGDEVVRVDGRAIERFETLQKVVRTSPGETLHVVVLRDGREVELVVTPRLIETRDRFGNLQHYGQLGVAREGVSFVRHDPASAVWAATKETASLTAITLQAIGQMIIGTRSTEELGGPIRIAQLSGQVAEDGIVTMMWFMAVLSINLGLINLFPIPMLDGGHLLFYGFEAIRGRPLGARAQEYGFRIGLAMVLTLMVFATWNDLIRLFS